MNCSLPVLDALDNPRHSTKKETRVPGSVPKLRPPKLNPKRSLNRRLFSSRPTSLYSIDKENNSGLCSIYNDTLDVSYFDQCFEPIAKIGEGSFGEVYKVKSKEDGRFYAVKKSKEFFRSDIDIKDRREEVIKHKNIPQHNNCISLLGAWEQDEHVYLLMELGITSLHKYTDDHHDIPEEHIWSILLDMLLALQHLHDHNMIHLDVKLENIIICENGLCKLGDFGLLLDLKGDMKDATEGDAKYLAPEVMDGKYTKAADVFSLGVAMLELAADLVLPSSGKLWHDIRDGTFPDDHANLQLQRRGISKELTNLIRRMTMKDFRKRPSVKSLMRHPRIRSLLKQRRENRAQTFNLQPDDLTLSPAIIRTSTPLPSTPPNNGLNLSDNVQIRVTQATPPTGFSRPDMNVICNMFNSTINNSRGDAFETDKNSFTTDSDVSSTSATPNPSSRSANPRPLPLYSSAKKLDFMFSD